MHLEPRILDNSVLSRRDVEDDAFTLRARPQSIYMDVSNRCNLRCIMCPYHWNGQDQRKATIMDKDLFMRVGAELFPYARNVYLFGGGEVFMHPQWDELFDFARQFSFLPIISTHGGLLNDRRIRALVEAGTQLRVSIDGATEETFNKIRIGGDFKRTVRGIERLAAEKARQGDAAERFLMRFSITSFDDNIREAPLIVELAARLGVEQVVFHHLMVDRNPLDGQQLSNFPDLADEMHCQAVEKGAELGVHVRVPPPFAPERFGDRLAEASAQVPPDRHQSYFGYPLGPDQSYTCRVPWTETWVKTDGRVMPCCVISKELSLGDVSSGPFADVWNGPDYVAFRRDINSPHPPSTCGVDTCTYRIHQKDRGLIQLGRDGGVRLDSRCPGNLQVRWESQDLHFEGRQLRGVVLVHNDGDTHWLAQAPQDVGSVRLGLKSLSSAAGEEGDFGRVLLEQDVAPGQSAELRVTAELPPDAAGFKLDLVVEGVQWFESLGNDTVVMRQEDR